MATSLNRDLLRCGNSHPVTTLAWAGSFCEYSTQSLPVAYGQYPLYAGLGTPCCLVDAGVWVRGGVEPAECIRVAHMEIVP